MALPSDYLRPIWRADMGPSGVGALGLDPREAEWVLEHGATLDGEPVRCTLEGWDGKPGKDGRVTVRVMRTSNLRVLRPAGYSWWKEEVA